jgi:outer membrane immunogenic protein
MKTKLLAAASLAALCSLYSLTASNATPFEGVYIGLHGGAGMADVDYVHFQPLIPLTEPLSFSDSGPVGGAQLGVRFDIGPNWVLGLEGTYTAGTLDETLVSLAIGDRSRTVEVSDQFTAVLQLGHTWGDWMLYLKGGYANAEIDIQSNVISSGVLTSTSSDRESGWTIGAGIDHVIAPNLVLGFSYDYSNYSPDDRSNVDVNGFTVQHHQDIDATVHLITARLSWTF